MSCTVIDLYILYYIRYLRFNRNIKWLNSYLLNLG